MPTHTILVVEDEAPIRQAIELKFTNKGCGVTACGDGVAAMKELNDRIFDAIVLDLVLPEKDGFDVLKEMASTKNAKTPVFVVTNLGADEHAEKAKKLGARECFVKSQVDLKEVVETVLTAIS